VDLKFYLLLVETLKVMRNCSERSKNNAAPRDCASCMQRITYRSADQLAQ